MQLKPAVLQVIPSLDAGGAERTTIDIARALVADGFRALVISEGGRLEQELLETGAEFISMRVASKSPFRIFANARKMASIIRDQNVVLIHARSRAPAWSARMAARRTGIPFVTTYHGIYNAKGWLKRRYNSIMARGDAVIANSQWTAWHILSAYKFIPKNLTVIPRGLDLNYFNPDSVQAERVTALRERWRAGEGQRIVLLPGRLSRWKGQLVLIRAFARLKQKKLLPANVRGIIAGDLQGRRLYLREISRSIRKNHLRDWIQIAPHVEDMPAAYLAADIVISASTEPEAFGRVPPEAAAMGRPVIATDHGGARETILAGRSGLLVKPGSTTDLADALLDLLERSPSELAAMGARGRAYIEERFTVERMCAATLDLYRKLIAENVR